MRLFMFAALFASSILAAEPFKIAVIGLTHGHVSGFFNAALKRDDIQIVGIAEPNRALFDKYADLQETPAQFQERCGQIALACFWREQEDERLGLCGPPEPWDNASAEAPSHVLGRARELTEVR